MEKKDKDEKKEPVSFPVEEIKSTKVGGSMKWLRTILMWFLTTFAVCYVASKSVDSWREIRELSGNSAANSRVGTAFAQLSCEGLTSCENPVEIKGDRKRLIEPFRFTLEKDWNSTLLCHNGDSVVLYLSQGQFVFGPGTGPAPLQPADRNGFYAKPLSNGGTATLQFCNTNN